MPDDGEVAGKGLPQASRSAVADDPGLPVPTSPYGYAGG
jgi:hypothetical protein